MPKTVSWHGAALCAAWAGLILVCTVAYWPGLSGPFLFDDFRSLAELGDLGGVRDWISLKTFVFGGHSGPTGRPVALLSFLIDGNNWPTDAWPFKRTNLVIHILNGVLLGLIASRLMRITGIERSRARWLAWLCAAAWLLHPFLVSTTLYAVQRMAELSTLFVFAGLAGYLHGRALLASRALHGYLVMSASLAVFTSLAVLSKENGILLPLFVAVMEFTVFGADAARAVRPNRYWAGLFLGVPALLVAAVLIRAVLTTDIFEIVPPRDFSIYERVLTESRILLDYLRHWFVPELYTSGVFQDHFLKSEGLLKPVSTALSAVFHVALIGSSIIMRRRWPLAAFAVLFFYTGHLLESTVLNLELYFEHRNYLAAAFLYMPVLVALQTTLNRPLFVSLMIIGLAALAGFTRYTATVWQSYPTIVAASADKAPTSARAQQQRSMLLFNAQQTDEAFRVIDAAIERLPEDGSLRVWRTAMRCNLGTLTAEEFVQMSQRVAARPYDPRSLDLYQTFSSMVIEEQCPAVSAADLREFFASMLDVPLNADRGSKRFYQIKFFVGLLDIHLDEPQRAVTNFRDSLESRPDASRAMLMASLLASRRFYDEALQLSDMALARLDAEKGGTVRPSRVRESDILDFQQQLRDEQSAARAGGGTATIER